MKHPTIRPRDAATLALIRRDGRHPSVLMGQRGKSQAFMPERYVFPGGGVELGDRYVRPSGELAENVAARLARSCTPARARSLAAAAVRETFEETGLMLAAPSAPPKGKVRPEWNGFHARGLAPALDRLDYIYRAVTPPGQVRRFNARFFMAFADDLHGEIAGNGELHDIGWVSISEALKMPIPHITGVVLGQISRLLDDPGPREHVKTTPFLRHIGDKYLVEME
ncbi:MAG: NUDIX hydrolase [Rhodospirillaceae bacterium]|jgi:8-oxo-dGTP pyrophosphatase MutT (NUDIX family)|nr:NUDIX hydrolase [Rhodospirillaceae bacterium]MBT3927253.1 NUDIX hydrolase [Rhodospirillaceae bacterium]MBT4427533.1 NUDIX hydrolase [Rhodospirillaceae bacterium]MBT5675936.1 NUDIX hydrolase [Rhodospirillaceae bacterium]MBT5779602.1 NUDIX hydrolase [Rhodospirillaceae bacterium]